MLISELIRYLEREKEELGDVTVCVYDFCHDMPCEGIVGEFKEAQEYLNHCENETKKGDFLFLS